MLSDKLREGAQGKIFKLLFWVIILSFIFAGVGGYLIPRLNTDPVEVNDYKITAAEWNEQYNRQSQQLHRMYGASAARLLDNPEFVTSMRSQVLENMVDNVAFNTAVYQSDVRIGDEQVRDVIRNTPAFMKDGKFDNELYLASVRNMGMNPEYFGEQMRMSLLSDFIAVPVLRSASAPLPYEVKALSRLLSQYRIVDLYALNLDHIKASLTASDDEVKAYYDAHQDAYMAPASVQFTYLLLDTSKLKSEVKFTDADLEDYLNMNQDDFRVGERRDVSHILIKADDPKAADKIAAIDAAIAAGNADFAALAKEYSDDPGTASNGGSLGLVARNDLAADLDTAVFSLQAGQVSPQIKDNYGVHYVKVNKIEEPYVPAFADIKDAVQQAYVSDKARELYQEKVTTLSDLSFENPDSLDVTAEALKLPVQECKNLNQGDMQAPWPLNTEPLQEAAFREENYTSGVNSPVITISDGIAMVINISDHHDAALRPFEEVKADATEHVLTAKAQEQGDRILTDFAKALQQNPDTALPADVSKTADVRVDRGMSTLDSHFGLSVFAIPQEGNDRFCIGANKGLETLAVLKSVGQADDKTLAEYDALMRSQLVQYYQNDLQAALYRGARELCDIKYNQDAIDMINKQNQGAD